MEIIHEYIEERATHRLTWIIIWLIVVACFVELASPVSPPPLSFVFTLHNRADAKQGEVIARMVFHAIPREQGEFLLLKAPQLLIAGTGQSFA